MAWLNFHSLQLCTFCRNSSEADSPWTQEKLSALQAEKDAVEEELLEHMADQDVKQLKFKAVSRSPAL